MSVTNAIGGIIVIGAIAARSAMATRLISPCWPFSRILIASINIVGRLPRHPSHAQNVPERRKETHKGAKEAFHDSAVRLSISVAAISVHPQPRRPRHQETARRGNTYGIIGMAIAVVATIFGLGTDGLGWLLIAMPIGAGIGLIWHAGGNDPDAATGRHAAQLRGPGGGAGRLRHLPRAPAAHRREQTIQLVEIFSASSSVR